MAQSLVKGLRILFLFARDRQAMTVKDIAKGIRVPLPTVYRFVKTLTQTGVLEKDSHPGHYRLGLKLLELEAVVHQRLDVETVARPYVAKLAALSGETVQLMLLYAHRGICLLLEESSSTLRVAPDKGRILPLHAGASVQAMLAFLPEPDQRRILEGPSEQFTSNTIIDPRKLTRRLNVIRRQGYATSRGEVYAGAMGIAAPIFGPKGQVIASLAVSGPAQRIGERRRLITESVTTMAGEISRILGWEAGPPSEDKTERAQEGVP